MVHIPGAWSALLPRGRLANAVGCPKRRQQVRQAGTNGREACTSAEAQATLVLTKARLGLAGIGIERLDTEDATSSHQHTTHTIPPTASHTTNRHLQEYTHQEPLLLLACTVKGAGLAHMAAEAGRLDTLRLLVQLVGQYGPRLAARVQEVLSWSDSGLETLKSLRWVWCMCVKRVI